MISYFAMVNAWSLAGSILNGTFEEDYPMKETKITPLESDEYDIIHNKEFPDPEWKVEKAYNDYYFSDEDDGLDYDIDTMAPIDDMYMHHFTNAYSSYNDGWTQEFHRKELEKMDYEPQRNHQYKYHEQEILKDIEEYVSRTYQGHYTGTKHEFRKVQTIDLMAARDIAAQFCQANILKYGSRYGSKDGRNKTDLLKVIHYAMLLLHFDGHYGKESMPTNDFEQMP